MTIHKSARDHAMQGDKSAAIFCNTRKLLWPWRSGPGVGPRAELLQPFPLLFGNNGSRMMVPDSKWIWTSTASKWTPMDP